MSQMDFDRHAPDYRAAVNDAVGMAGADVDQLAGDKARLLLALMGRHLGDAKALKVLDVGCGIGLVDAELVSGVGELHGDRHEPEIAGRGRSRRAGRAVHALHRGADALCRGHVRSRVRHLRAAPRAPAPPGGLRRRDGAGGAPGRHRARPRAQPAEPGDPLHRLPVRLRPRRGAAAPRVRPQAAQRGRPRRAAAPATSPSGRNDPRSSSGSSGASGGCPRAPSTTPGRRRRAARLRRSRSGRRGADG